MLKSILFVYSDINCASTLLVCFELAQKIGKHVKCTAINYYQFDLRQVLQYDVIIFQRIGGNGTLITNKYIARMFGLIERYRHKKVFLYMIDDLVIEDQGGLPKRFMKECNAVICPNETMKRILSPYSRHSYILRTCTDLSAIERIKSVKMQGFNILWASTGGLGLQLIRSIISSVRDELDINFICIGGNAAKLGDMDGITAYPILPFGQMISILKECQVLLNPMVADRELSLRIEQRSKRTAEEFLNCKAEIKYVLAGAAGVVTISSKTDSYLFAIKNGINGLLVDDSVEEWVKAIKMLYNDEKMRRQLAYNAHQDVLKRYSMDATARQLISIAEDCIKKCQRS